MKIKVCGMRDELNVSQLLKFRPDYVGLIFYKKSARYVGENLSPDQIESSNSTKRVGVFVNEEVDKIVERVKQYDLEYIQLHGGEELELCSELKGKGIKIIKVFSVKDELPTEEMKAFEKYVDYFLFDTITSEYGGSGQKFNWKILGSYTSHIPYFLSGGIGPEDVSEIQKMGLKGLHAIDVNSRFEIEPGLKDLKKIRYAMELIRKKND